MNPRTFLTGGLGRRSLLILAGAAAAGAGVLVARRQPEATSRTGLAAPSPPPPASTPSQGAASAPLITGDLVGAAFWQQVFDTPQPPSAAPGSQAVATPPLKLAASQGRPVLLNFWATWCPPCVKEMPELERFHQAFAPKGWKVIGLAIDGPTPVREFLAKVGVGFDIGLAGFGGTELAQELGNTSGGLPFSVLIDAQGRVRHRKMGATSYKELAAWAQAMSADVTN